MHVFFRAGKFLKISYPPSILYWISYTGPCEGFLMTKNLAVLHIIFLSTAHKRAVEQIEVNAR